MVKNIFEMINSFDDQSAITNHFLEKVVKKVVKKVIKNIDNRSAITNHYLE